MGKENNIFSFNIKMVGKNIKGGRGTEIFGKKIQDLKKNAGGEEYQVVGNFIHTCGTFYFFNFFYL